jgi:hypothetical protein
MTHQELPRAAGGAWEIATEHGTRILLDLSNSRWMRVPKIDDDGRLNLVATDGRWQRLGFTQDVRVGSRAYIHTSLSEWWRTTTVVGIWPLSQAELPPDLPVAPDDLIDRIERDE